MDVHNLVGALETTGVIYVVSACQRTLVHKRLKIGPSFLLTLCKFCILLHCRASQMEISKRNSTKLCQTVDSKSFKFGGFTPTNWGAKTAYFVTVLIWTKLCQITKNGAGVLPTFHRRSS